MAVTETTKFGKKLCNVLKLDSSKTRTISISVEPNDVVYVRVGQYLQNKEAEEILKLIKTYELIPTDITDEIETI